MSKRSDLRWRAVAKLLRISGVIGCAVFFVSHFALLAFYSAHRPGVPQPERGLTTGLTWTHPVRYGTEQDESRSQWLFELFFPSFGLVIAGELIKIYRLDDYSGLRPRTRPPWNHKWGP
jgi:hypothetical protein